MERGPDLNPLPVLILGRKPVLYVRLGRRQMQTCDPVRIGYVSLHLMMVIMWCGEAEQLAYPTLPQGVVNDRYIKTGFAFSMQSCFCSGFPP
ncbi:hypothetical protein EYF80_015016 [Liparis tanakae]|uniref:Uncharacterized protein n=1 Tax=Liparis tanakae TaxID=230148 RepID=A0A4Z2I9Q3_9TELE|nr:hypothetical protein EYF80_015016 [Liparis tanakae]